MSHITAFNCTFAQMVDPRLQCDICLNIMMKPVTLGCGHSGCENCLNTLATIGNPKCPQCRVPFRGGQLSVNVTLDNITRHLPVECTNQGCDWKGKYTDAEGHWKECPKVEEKCPNECCGHMATREAMKEHVDVCPKQEIPCSKCKLTVLRDRLGRHHATMCGTSVVQCPLRCGTSLPRNQVNLHQHQWPKKAVQCSVTGCRKIMMREDYPQHISEAAGSHFQLQYGEIQRLRRTIHEKNYSTLSTAAKDDKVVSFNWEIKDFPASLALQQDSNEEPLTSGAFSCGGERWRAVLTGEKKLYLQLISSSRPVTAEIRIVMMPGEEKEKVFLLQQVTLNEGEMWGRELKDINKWVDETGRVQIKFIIYYVSF